MSNLIEVFQFTTVENFESNLAEVIYQYEQNPEGLIAVFPEVALTGFAFHCMEEAALFSIKATAALKEVVQSKALLITMIEKEGDEYVNVAKVFHRGEIIHTQRKHKLFILGQERNYFKAGEREEIVHFSLDGIPCAILICFELRFPELWTQINGAEIIFVPAMWGANRADHYETLTKALAITNRAYVVACDSANPEYAKESGIITPWGEAHRDNDEEYLAMEFSPKDITFMHRAIPYE